MIENIASYTEPSSNYPQYISINRKDGHVEITVRSKCKPFGVCGDTAMVKLSESDWSTIVHKIKTEE